MLVDSASLYVSGHTDSGMMVGGISINNASMFVIKFGIDGSIDWLQEMDTFKGYDSKLAIYDETLHVSAEAGVFKSRILQIDESGNIISVEYMEECLIGDMDFDDSGNLYVTGNLTAPSLIDSLALNPPFSYTNYLVKFDRLLNAEWVRYSPYVTLDHHQRVKAYANRIAIAHRIISPPSLVKLMIKYYKPDGSEVDSILLQSMSTVPFSEIAAAGDELIVMYDKYNYSNPAISDTIVFLHFDTNLVITEQHFINCYIPSSLGDLYPIKIAANQCNVFAAVNYQSDSIIFDTTFVIDELHPDNNNVVIRYDRGCMQTPPPTSAVDLILSEDILVYPNPASSYISIRSENANLLNVDIISVQGILVKSISFTDTYSNIDVSGLQNGLYILRIVSEYQVSLKKLTKVY